MRTIPNVAALAAVVLLIAACGGNAAPGSSQAFSGSCMIYRLRPRRAH